jgi:hypothetical protein
MNFGCIVNRWRSKRPINQLFWRDMLAWGTLLNMVFLFFTLMLYAQRADPWMAMVLHVTVVPLNLFLVLSIWKHPQAHGGFKAVSVLCLGMTFLA